MIQILYTGGTIGMVPTAHGLAPNSEQFSTAVQSFIQQPVRWKSLEPLIDSSQITPLHWQRILDNIDDTADSTIILHGTDTLAYTAAILSFFANPDHSIFLTGAQLSWFEETSDAPANLSLALAQPCQPGTRIVFGGRVLPGHTSYKQHTEAHAGFSHYTAAPMPSLKNAIKLPDLQYRWLTPTPGQSYPDASKVDVLILENLGSGQMPNCPALQAHIELADLVLVTSQCTQGSVDLYRYAAASELVRQQAIGCGHARREEIIAACFAAKAAQPEGMHSWLTTYFGQRR